jgi:hypothetical protein
MQEFMFLSRRMRLAPMRANAIFQKGFQNCTKYYGSQDQARRHEQQASDEHFGGLHVDRPKPGVFQCEANQDEYQI